MTNVAEYKQAPPVLRPPYVDLPGVEDPQLAKVPEVDLFMQLSPGEQVVRSYATRVKRPKFPWVPFLLTLIPTFIPVMVVLSNYWRAVRWYEYDLESWEYSTGERQYYSTKESESVPAYEYHDVTPPSDDSSDSLYNSDSVPEDAVPDYKMEDDFKGPTEPAPYYNDFKSGAIETGQPQRWNYSDTGRSINGSSPLVSTRAPAALPSLTLAQLETTLPRPQRPTFPWFRLFFVVGGYLLLPFGIAGGYFLFRTRGHTFLYLTPQRLIIVELEKGIFRRTQTLLNFSLDNVAGFTLMAQRGLTRLFNLLVLRERRTFYLSIVTRSYSGFNYGARRTYRSKYDPGRDAVALCAELDAMVLQLKAARPVT